MTIDTTTESSTAATTATSMIDPDGLNNTLVAESDFAAARQTLLEFPDKKRLAAKDVDASTTEIHQLVSQSILDHLQAAVRPVTDEAFHMYCHELQKNNGGADDEYSDDDDEKEETAMDDDEQAKDKNDNDDNDDSYGNDWQDWINQETLERVRTLRNQVRNQAEKVGKVREGVLEQAVSLARRRCGADGNSTSNTSGAASNASINLERRSSGIENTAENNNNQAAATAVYDQKVVEMQESMQRMKQTLAKVETRLPESVRQWQETLDTIEGEHGMMSSSQQQPPPLSQTEQAIMEREDEDDEDQVMDDEHEPLSAEERLARFVASDMTF